MPGFEDVDVALMLKEMVKAIPCLLLSIALWWGVLRKTDKTPVVKKHLELKELLQKIRTLKPLDSIRSWFSGLTYWKWIASFAVCGIYILINQILGRGFYAQSVLTTIAILVILWIFGVFHTNDLENMMLIIASGLFGSRHGVFFRGFNLVYPILSFLIAIALFLPGELRASAKEGKAALKKETAVIHHDRLVYYLPAGYLTTAILYFLTSF